MKKRRCRQSGRFVCFLLLPFLLLSVFSACQSTLPDPESAMQTFCRRYPSCPAGRVLVIGREEYESGAMPKRLPEVLFGSDVSSLPLQEGMESGAIFLGSSAVEPAECGIFACRSRDEAMKAATACLSRIDRLRRAFPASPSLLFADVQIYGDTVVYCVMPDNRMAFRIWESIL